MLDHFDQFFAEHPEWRECSDLVVMPPTAAEAIEEWDDLEESDLIKHPDEDSSFGVTRLALYIRARRKGASHRFAEMCAAQRPPQCMTDDVFFAGTKTWQEDMHPAQRRKIYALAKARGYTPPADAMYHSGLARFPGDPEAFVSRSDGRGYIKRLCEKRGWACEGAVEVPARPPDKDPLAYGNCVSLGDDIIRDKARGMVRENPGLATLSRQQLRQKVIERYGPSPG